MNNPNIPVTGASAGIGLECANRLASAGWTVVGARSSRHVGRSWQGLRWTSTAMTQLKVRSITSSANTGN